MDALDREVVVRAGVSLLLLDENLGVQLRHVLDAVEALRDRIIMLAEDKNILGDELLPADSLCGVHDTLVASRDVLEVVLEARVLEDVAVLHENALTVLADVVVLQLLVELLPIV